MQEIYAEKFRRQAVESRRKAKKAAPRDKRAWLKIAEHWLRLVQGEDQYQEWRRLRIAHHHSARPVPL